MFEINLYIVKKKIRYFLYIGNIYREFATQIHYLHKLTYLSI